MPAADVAASDLTFNNGSGYSGYLAALLLAVVLLSMLAAYMCLLRAEMRSEFEESRAWRLRWQEESVHFPLPPFQLELCGPVVPDHVPDHVDPDGHSGRSERGHVRYLLEVLTDGRLRGQSWRPRQGDIAEAKVQGKLRMSSVAFGELRWREGGGCGGDPAREVVGTLLLDAGQVQIEATYIQQDAKTGPLQLRGTIRVSRGVLVPCDVDSEDEKSTAVATEVSPVATTSTMDGVVP